MKTVFDILDKYMFRIGCAMEGCEGELRHYGEFEYIDPGYICTECGESYTVEAVLGLIMTAKQYVEANVQKA